MKQLYAIIVALEKKELGPAKKWCSENRTKLSKSNSLLEFKLVLMEFFQLLQEKKKLEAVDFIRQ